MTVTAAPREHLDQAQAVIQAATDGGLTAAVGALHRAFSAETGLFDVHGNSLAQSPIHSIWDWRAVLRLRNTAPLPDDTPLTVREVVYQGEVVALLAVRREVDPRGVIEVAAKIIALDLMRLRAKQEGRRELAVNVLEDIISNRVSSKEVPVRLAALGLDADRPFRVFVGSADGPPDRLMRTPWNVHTLMSEQADPFIRVLFRGKLLAIVSDDLMLDRVAATILAHLRDCGSNARLGISRSQRGIDGIRIGYYEASTRTENGLGVQSSSFTDLTQIVVVGNTTLPLEEISRELLSPLVSYDTTQGTHLLSTLRVFLEMNRDINKTADSLFVHPNTLRYRLKRMAELLEVDLEETSVLTTLWIALEAMGKEPLE